MARSILKKVHGTVIDFVYSKTGSTLKIDGEYLASCWQPFDEKSRKEQVALLVLLRDLLADMVEQQQDLPIQEVDKDWLKNLDKLD